MTRLEAIEARANAVPMPLRAVSDGCGPKRRVQVYDLGIARPIATIWKDAKDPFAVAEFFAEARQDIPWLLARLRECEMALEAVPGTHEAGWCARYKDLVLGQEPRDCTCHVVLVTAALEGIRG